MENTTIEWADHTFNPWEGCTKVSPGCANCYAEARNHRFGGDNWGPGKPRRRTRPSNWRKPLIWNRGNVVCLTCGTWYPCVVWRSLHPNTARCLKCSDVTVMQCRRPRVFCASLADWLDDEVPIEWLADLLRLIHDTPNLDWLLLTKRPENFQGRMEQVCVHVAGEPPSGYARMVRQWYCATQKHAPEFIPHNVWIGTTVEDQTRADERIPHLLKIPAKVRFLSCEPLLGPVDLKAAFEVWEYCASCGESFDYIPDRPDVCPKCKVPNCMSAGFGAAVRERFDEEMGGVEVGDGSPIHWVICGGESGRGDNIRPMHPDWARSLRDQCQAAGVPFFFKQWGEWAPSCAQYPASEDEYAEAERAGNCGDIALEPDGTIAEGYQPRSNRTWLMDRVGKKAAGRLLDGREWNEFPSV